MKATKRILLIVALGYLATGCCFFDFLTGPHGFTIKTVFITPPSPTQRQMINPDPGVQVTGNWQGDNGLGSPCGSKITFSVSTDSEGKAKDCDWRVPAVWNFARSGGHCGIIFNIIQAVSCGQEAPLVCNQVGTVFSMSPNAIDVNAPPATATLTGQGLDATYGMPIVEFYDEYGSYLDVTTASAVSADGTWLEASVPNLTGAYSGTYTVVIVNQTPDGTRNVVGTATVWVYGNDMPPPPPDPLPDPNPCYSSECVVY